MPTDYDEDDIIADANADADEVEIDMTGDTSGPVPAGRYLTRIDGFKEGKKSSKGERMISFIYRFADPDHPEFSKRTSYRSFMLEGNGVGFLTDILEAFDQPRDKASGKVKFSKSALTSADPILLYWVTSDYNPKFNDVELKEPDGFVAHDYSESVEDDE